MADAVELSILIKAVDEATAILKQIEGSTAHVGEVAKEASEKTGLLGEAFKGLTAGVAVGIGITAAADAIHGLGEAIPHAIEGVTELGSEVRKMERETGASAETSSMLLAAFERFGVSSDAASRALGIFAKNLNTYADSTLAAQSKSTGFAGAIDSLGLKVKDSSGALVPMSEQLLNVADKFHELPDGVEKTADAMALFGRSGKDMILLLNQGREGLQEAMDAANRYGLVLSGDNIDAIRQFGRAHKDLDEAMKGVTLQIGVALIPVLANLAQGAAGLAQGFNESVLPGIKALGGAIDDFTKSEGFQMWAARLLAVTGLIGDGIGALAGVFSSALGGILDIVNTVGQAIYQGLQWINPFASHSPPLVSQVQDGVAAIQAAYGSLDGLTSTFDGIGAAFEDLSSKTTDFSNTVDDVSTKTEKSLAIMGPGVTDAFNAATVAVTDAKSSLADIKSAWDDATAALVPLKDNLDASKDALKDQQDILTGLKGQLTDAKSVFDPLNQALKDATQNAKDADAAIKNLTNAPIAGSAEFTKKISDANIELKTQALALSNVKQSTAYTSLSDQIDAATAKLKEMQRAQSAAPTVSAGQSASQRAAVTAASNAARAAISDQQVALDALKTKQTDLLAPAQKKLELDRNALDTINLQRDATIGVAQEQIKQAAATASGIKEQTQAQIEAGIAAAGAARTAAMGQVDVLTPQVAAQQAVMDGLTAKIHDQEKAVADAKATSDTANTTYTDAKIKVDDLGKAYRDTKAEIATYDQQLKATIATGDMQVQKIKAAEAAAKAAARAALAARDPATSAEDDGSMASKLEAAKQKAETFGKAIEQAHQDVSDFIRPVTDAATALGTFLAPLSGLGHWLSVAGLAFLAFSVAAGPVWGLLTKFVAPIVELAPKLALLVTPVGLVTLAIAGLGVAIATNFGGIREKLQPFIDGLSSLATDVTPILANFGTVIDKAFGGDFTGAFDTFVSTIGSVADLIVPAVAGWAAAFVGWIVPTSQELLGNLRDLLGAVVAWAKTAAGTLATAALSWGVAFIAWVPQVPAIVTALGGVLAGIFAWISQQAKSFGTALMIWGAQFSGWVGATVQPMLDELGKLKDRAVTWITDEAALAIGKALTTWVTAFGGWVVDAIKNLPSNLVTIIDSIKTWADANGPEIGKRGEAIGGALVHGIVSGLSTLNENVGKAIRDGLGDFKPIASAFADALGSQITGALDSLKKTVQDAVVWLGQLRVELAKRNVVEDLRSAWHDLSDAGKILFGVFKDTWGSVKDLFKSFQDLLPPVKDTNRALSGDTSSTDRSASNAAEGIKGVTSAIRDFAAQVKGFVQFLKDAGTALDNLNINVGNAGVGVHNFIGGILTDLGKAAADIFPAGAAVVDGLLAGIASKLDEIGNSAKTYIVDPLVDSVRKLLGIASPSTVFAEIGGEVIAGLLKGLSDAWADVETWLSSTFSSDGAIVKAIPDAGKLLVSVGSDLLKGVLAGLDQFWTAADGLYAWLVDLVNQVFAAIESSKPLDALTSVGTDLMDGLFSGVKSGWSDIQDWFFNLKWPSLPEFPSISMPSLPGGIGGGGGTGATGNTQAGTSSVAGWNPSVVESYIRQQAPKYGEDPNVAARVAGSEGLNNPIGDRGMSFGPFQLYTGGGLGNAFQQQTGLNPADFQNNWRQQVDFALKWASQNGWNPGGARTATGATGGGFHGATVAGIGNWQGIGVSTGAAIAAADAASNLDLPDTGPLNTMHGAFIPGGQSMASVGNPKALQATDAALKSTARDAQAFATQYNRSLISTDSTSASVLARDIPKDAQSTSDALSTVGGASGDAFTKVILDVQQFADKAGVSIDAANAVLMDHGKVAQEVFGTQLPAAADLADQSVEDFAGKLGISWDDARAILTAGGKVADAVMGKQIPAAAQSTVDAVGSVGNKALWDMIRGNATDTGRDLSKYLKDIGAPAINRATASLDDLVKASGLSLPQVQREAGAAGKDIRAWLLTVGVPAADALAKSLGVEGLTGAATDLKKPVDDAVSAVGNIKKPVDDAKGAVDDFGGKAGDAGTKMATQFSAVLQQLVDRKNDNNIFVLIDAVQTLAEKLSALHNVSIDIVTNFKSTGSGSGGGGGSDTSEGASGPGGSLAQARQNAANAAALVIPSAARGDTNFQPSGGGGQSINSSVPGAGRTNPNQFASGGAFTPGKPYMVGERGMEIITPSHAGMVHHVGASKMIAEALSNWPSSETVNHTVKALDLIQAQFNALPKSVQVRAQVLASPASTASPAAGFQQGYQPRPAGAASSTGHPSNKLSQQDAQMIANELAKALHSNPPRVALEDVRSGLILVGQRNGGYVGLA